ncbi:MAG: DUF302 domain-containing protein [candidate division Zixibacteria bacterium]|nr:DUF302 domain-containing protein [candidate division Zixibacteria bacterium]
MMSNKIVVFLAGVFSGLVMMGAVVWFSLPSLMIAEYESSMGFDDTIEAINRTAADRGWLNPKTYDIQKSLQKAGYPDMTKLRIMSLCQPDHAYTILKDDDNKVVSAMMPCRFGIYETADGNVSITGLNIGLMSKMFGGQIAEVMGAVEREQSEILSGIIKN